MDNVIVWDLETIPDLDGYAAVRSLTTQAPDEVREALGQAFPKLIFHKIICIGALISSRTDDGCFVRTLGAPNVGSRSEYDLIQSFVDKIRELSPTLVTFNGSSFDLPVLRYRAMRYAISAPGLDARPYFHRYTEDAIDLCDVLSSFDQRARVSLNDLAKLLGFAGKPENMDGSQVEQLYKDGRLAEIASYCESDVVETYRVWLRYELFRGTLTPSQYAWSESNLQSFLRSRSSVS